MKYLLVVILASFSITVFASENENDQQQVKLKALFRCSEGGAYHDASELYLAFGDVKTRIEMTDQEILGYAYNQIILTSMTGRTIIIGETNRAELDKGCEGRATYILANIAISESLLTEINTQYSKICRPGVAFPIEGIDWHGRRNITLTLTDGVSTISVTGVQWLAYKTLKDCREHRNIVETRNF